MEQYQSLAVTAWALCCEAGAEYGQVGYDACLAWCERMAQGGKPHSHSVDGLVKLWRTQARHELYTSPEYGRHDAPVDAPARRAMYTELARQAWFYAALRPVFGDLKERADGLARATRRASLRHSLAPIYYAMANDAKRLLLAYPDVVPGDTQTRRQTILDMAQARQRDRDKRRRQHDAWAARAHSQREHTGPQARRQPGQLTKLEQRERDFADLERMMR